MPDIVLPEKPSDREEGWDSKYSNSMPFVAFVHSITESNYHKYVDILWAQPQGLEQFLADCLPSELNLLLGHPLWSKMEDSIVRLRNCQALFDSIRVKLIRYNLWFLGQDHSLVGHSSFMDPFARSMGAYRLKAQKKSSFKQRLFVRMEDVLNRFTSISDGSTLEDRAMVLVHAVDVFRAVKNALEANRAQRSSLYCIANKTLGAMSQLFKLGASALPPPYVGTLDQWFDLESSAALYSMGSEADPEDVLVPQREPHTPDDKVDYNRHGRKAYSYIASRVTLFFSQEPLPWPNDSESPIQGIITQRIIDGMSAPKITRDINAIMAIIRSTREDVAELQNVLFARDMLEEYIKKMDDLLEELQGIVQVSERWEQVLTDLPSCHQ